MDLPSSLSHIQIGIFFFKRREKITAQESNETVLLVLLLLDEIMLEEGSPLMTNGAGRGGSNGRMRNEPANEPLPKRGGGKIVGVGPRRRKNRPLLHASGPRRRPLLSSLSLSLSESAHKIFHR